MADDNGAGTDRFHIATRAPRAVAVPARSSLAPVAPSDADASDWWRYGRAIARRKWIVLGVTLAGTLAGFAATRFVAPKYSARATLWIESTGRERGPTDEQLLGGSGWVELVTSSVVLDSVVRDLRLYLSPRSPADVAGLSTFGIKDRPRPGEYRLTVDRAGERYRLTTADGAVTRDGVLGDSIAPDLGIAWVVAPGALRGGQVVEFSVTAPSDATLALAHGLKVHVDPAGNFLRLQLKGASATRAAATLNAISERVVSVAADLKRQKFEELERILGGQMQHAHGVLLGAERSLKDFRVRTADVTRDEDRLLRRGADPRDEDPETDPLILRATLEEVQRDGRLLDAILADTSGATPVVEALATVRAVRQSPELTLALQEAVAKRAELRAYRYKYTEESEPVRRVRGELDVLERRRIPALLRELRAELGVRLATLSPRVDSAMQTRRDAPPLALAETRLERDVASAEELYTTVRQRYEGARLALISSLPDVRILDRAVPLERPVSDFAPLIVLLATVASFGLVVAGVTVADRADPRVHAPEQVTQGLNLTILAAVPHVRRSAENGDGAAPVIEALRGLRLRLLNAAATPGFAVTVTSPGPGEGKSFISANLALSFAQAGYRVALVDGDIRRGTQHRVLEAAGTPGLTDVLIGSAKLEAAMQETPHAGVSLLSAGRRLHRGPELLLSRGMRETMSTLRQAYDVVVVDSPPLAAGVDPLVLGTVTGRLLLVIRAGTTDFQMAASKLDVLESLPVEALGAVLNDVRPQGAYRYYTYGLPGYELPADDRAAAQWNEPPRIVGGEG